MSELAQKLFESMKAVKDTGLSTLGDILADCKAEVGHQASHGATELASALFNQQAFVLYGHNHSSPSAEHQHQMEHDRGIER